MREGWVRKSISEICDKASSNIAQNKIADIDGDYPVYGASGYVQNVDFYHRDTDYIGIVKDGSGVGRVNVYPAYSSLLGTMQYIIPKDGYLLGYVAYALKGLNLSSFASGAAIPHIYFKDYGKCKIDVPPLSEQQRIVSELDLLSSIIEKKKAQLKEYDQLAQSIFYDMFGDPVTNEKGWEVKKLGEISEIGTGATPSREKEELYYGGDIHWVKTTEVHNCDITNTEETITQLAIQETNCKIYPPNTLLMAMYGQGKTRGQIAKLKISAATNQACAAIVLEESVCNLDFIFLLLLIKYEDIRAMAQGGNQANLNLKLVGSIPIIIPSLDLQNQFAEKIESIEKQKALVQQSIVETQTMFDYTMDKYFG